MHPFQFGPIRIISDPYWGAWKCDGGVNIHPRLGILRADCKCGFRSEDVPRNRYQEIIDLLDWHSQQMFERLHRNWS